MDPDSHLLHAWLFQPCGFLIESQLCGEFLSWSLGVGSAFLPRLYPGTSPCEVSGLVYECQVCLAYKQWGRTALHGV